MDRRYSYNWIKEHVNLKADAAEFAREFSLHSMTVDRTNEVKNQFKNIITAKILKVEPHPNADRLQLATVDTGKGEFRVVCGAPNIAVGQIVAYAPEGAELANPENPAEPFILKPAKIRGIESRGMICAPDELGLSDNHDYTLELPQNTPMGKDFAALLKDKDFILDIEITTNRPDAMSVIGLAREAAAVFKTSMKQVLPQPDMNFKEEKSLSVKVVESKMCSRYQAVVMENVTIGPSPLWMQLRLMQSGIRPICNMVDITNYILLEYGQPMHVFDYDKVEGQKLQIRYAKNKEKLLALDGNTYNLKENHLVIADGKNPVAIAGVMGGLDSSVNSETKTIIFECANFDPISVRKTARELNLHSESSSLFEKNLHSESTLVALLKAMVFTQEIAGGKAASPIIDINSDNYKPLVVNFYIDEVKRLLGVELKSGQVKKILESLGLEAYGTDKLKLTIPWWRANDLQYDHDIIEEIARLYGYHNLPANLPMGEPPVIVRDEVLIWEQRAKEFLASIGFNEVFNYSMISEELQQKLNVLTDKEVVINNPLTEEMTRMRTSLIPQILETVSYNQHLFKEQMIFELSNVYHLQKPKDLPKEKSILVGAVMGEKSFHTAKGAVEFLLKKLGVTNYEFVKIKDSQNIFDKDASLEILIDGKNTGYLGMINQKVLNKFSIDYPVAIFDFRFGDLVSHCSTVTSFVQVPEFPDSNRDVAVIVDNEIAWKEIKDVVSRVNELISEVSYVSTYVDDKLGENKKSLAFRIIFRAKDRTLKSEEVDVMINKIIKELGKDFGAKLR